MKNAIGIVFPNTQHLWCLWHIKKKAPEKLLRFSKFKDIKHDLKLLAYESSSASDFECGWANFIANFQLQSNE